MLNDVAIRRTKPRASAFEVTDTRGLSLRIHPTGRKGWVLRVVIKGTGERVRLDLGDYPGVTLAAARDAADQKRAEAKAGRDPRGEQGEMTVSAALNCWLKDAGLRSEQQM